MAKGDAKYGRAKRRASTAAYNTEGRASLNAKRRQRKHAIQMERDRRKPLRMKTPKGSARAARRAPLQ